ncbi:MAG TPA: tetratricopeptide repeat protein, partial [Nannocystis sp.]
LIEYGWRTEQQGGDLTLALTSYRSALAEVPDHPVASALAIECALRSGSRDVAEPLLARQLEILDIPGLRAADLLDLADLAETPQRRREQLLLAIANDPHETTALRRLIRVLRAEGADAPPILELPGLYRRLAALAADHVTAASALQLAVLTSGTAEVPRDVLEDIRTWLAAHGKDPAAHGILDALVSNFAQRDPRGTQEHGVEGLRGVDVLVRLAAYKDDPREQAILREQIARLRWEASPLASRQSALDDDGTLRRLAEEDAAPPALPDAERDAYRVLESDLRFVRRYLPEQRWVWQALASVLRVLGDTTALIAHLTEWAQTRSHGTERATILLRLGFVHERLEHDMSRAAEVYELAVAEDPKNTACLRALGSVYERMRRWAQAAAILQRQARETTDGPERLAALRRVAAIAEQELHDVDLAIGTLQEIAQIDQDDVLSLFQLAALCRTHDRANILIQTLQLLVERLDEDIARTAILVELGEAHETRLKQRTAARESYERALKLSPGYTPALRALARLYRDGGDLEALLRLHEPDVDATSDPAVLALKAGRICFEELGDMERAIGYLWRSYRINPDLVPAREILLQLLSATGKIRDAYDLLRAQDPPHSPALLADYHYRLGLIAEALARQGHDNPLANALADEDRALQHYRAALAVQHDHGLAFERSRRLLVANNDLPNLIRLLEDQLQHASGSNRAALLVQLARLHLGTGDFERARGSYEIAIEAAPDDGVILREYKTLLRKLGDTTTLPTLRLRLARTSEDTHYKATLLVESAEVLLQSEAPEDREFAAGAILGALR